MFGKVKWYDNARGFGYIESEDGSDLFFDRTAVFYSGRVALSHGMHIEFDLAKSGGKDRAINLHVLA
ncbi:MAG TPA: cold shock domain-containing protein [Syntrophomonas sp.]|jgi:CspA family cold shock protein|nr:cold shock domain-containing protein [Syntrophomonas sp.]